MASKIKPVARVSLSDGIVQQIIDLISHGVLEPGERLPPERDLCKQFGVGRSSLREALRSLCIFGIIEVRLGEGTFISTGSAKYLEKILQWGYLLEPKILDDLMETRIFLEAQTAFLAAQRATPENLKDIGQTIRGMEESLGSYERFLDYDMQFHLAIAKATQNNFFCYLLSTTRVHLQEWIKNSFSEPLLAKEYSHEAALREHIKIFEGIRRSCPEEARDAMTNHIKARFALIREVYAKSEKTAFAKDVQLSSPTQNPDKAIAPP
jgi:GntR family transcriptional regulator, transcriptional repressor for pyruvate dehydrogenase complex